jgi:hypothetical protein
MFTAALDAMLILGPLVANADETAGYRVGNAEICIGNTMPYTGWQTFVTIGNAEAAYSI